MVMRMPSVNVSILMAPEKSCLPLPEHGTNVSLPSSSWMSWAWTLSCSPQVWGVGCGAFAIDSPWC